MPLERQTTELLTVTAKVLGRCFVFGFVLLLIWAAAYVFLQVPIHVQGQMFGLTPHDVSVIHYVGMAFVKMCVLLFFLFPYLSIRLVLRTATTGL